MTTLEHHTADVGGTRLHYVTCGSGPAVLLLHGWPQTWYEWRHVAAALEGHTVVMPDLRGFGYSAKPAAGYDAETMAGDLHGLVSMLGLRDVTVVGHDWGAVFGYVYAALHPGEVVALGIVEMALPGVGVMEGAMQPRPGGQWLWHMGFQSVPDIPELLVSGHERAYLQWFFEHFAYNPTAITAADLDEYVSAIMQVGALRAGMGVYQAYFETAEQVVSHAKKPLEMPVVAYGGDTCLGEYTLASVRAVAPDAEGGVIEQCGHWAPEERPEFVAGLIRELAARSAQVPA
ncbi:MAG: alpha/beta hydrolase [Actinomycetota bacterium]|nr:alpha/beta hydrolase [Actinomycetota bacterium]